MKKIFTLVIAITAVAFTSHAQNTWTQKASLTDGERRFAVGFSIGNKVYIGTGYLYDWTNNIGTIYKDLWEFDPVNDSWSQKADFGGAAREAAVGFSIDEKGYIGTGEYFKDFWEYDPEDNVWTQKADYPGGSIGFAVGFSIGTKAYIGTGYDGYYHKDFWEYDPPSDTWTQKTDFGGIGRYGAVGFSAGNKGYIGTGISDTNGLLRDFWEYDPANDLWLQKADCGGDPRFYATGFNILDKGYIATGSTDFGNASDLWKYDPVADGWAQQANVGGYGRAAATGLSCNDKGYIGTGVNSSGIFLSDFWEYTPDNSCTTPTATITPLGNLDICETGFVKLQASSGNNYTYQWNRNNVNIPAATNQIFKAKKTGNYRVAVVDGECHAVSKKTKVYSSCKLGEEDEFISSFNLFPNPTTGTFKLDLKVDDEENSQATIQVLNMLGQVVYDETTSIINGVLQKEIQLSDAAAEGMYLVKVIINDKVFSSQINYQK